jgi:uncharacterized membrane protein
VFVAIVLIVCFALILNTRSRLSRMEQRIRILEDARREAHPESVTDAETWPGTVTEMAVVQATAPPPEIVEPLPESMAPVEAEMSAKRRPARIVHRRAVLDVPVVEAIGSDVPLEPEASEAAEPTVEAAASEAPAEAVAAAARVEVADAPAQPRGLSINFEDLFGRRLPIWAGGITLAIAGVFIVKLAIDAGFFAPWVRVVCGLLFGTALIGGAEAALRAEAKVRDDRVRQALSGAGLATLYASVLMASNGYGLIGPAAAFAGMALITAGALALSIRFGAPSALLGLAGGLATPALVGSAQPDIPLLSSYLALTIGGLTAVSRMKRWAWLGVSALLGGAGWSLLLILNGALDLASSLSVGVLVMLLALGLPLLAFAGPRATTLRSLTALVGAGQLALLVAVGGFTPLNWGLFALIAIAGQWLSWREGGFEIVPSIGLGLSALLLAVWPDPDAGWFAAIGGAMALIHGAPLLLKLWRDPPRFQRALELSALSLAIPALTALHFYRHDGSIDNLLALLATLGAAVSALGAGLGWKKPERLTDARFALLATSTGFLLACALALILPYWALPFGVAAIAAAMLLMGERARDARLEPVAAAFAAAALPILFASDPGAIGETVRLAGVDARGADIQGLARWLGVGAVFALFAARAAARPIRLGGYLVATLLGYGALAQVAPGWAMPLALGVAVLGLFLAGMRKADLRIEAIAGVVALGAPALLSITGDHPYDEWLRLGGAGDPAIDPLALLRWVAVAALGLLFAVRARTPAIRMIGQGLAALFVYGALAQLMPAAALPATAAAGLIGLSVLARRSDWISFVPSTGMLASIVALWAAEPAATWLGAALLSLGGLPMTIDVALLSVSSVLERLLAPVVLAGVALWHGRALLSRRTAVVVASTIAVPALMALHSLYRIGFAAVAGDDFAATGLAERCIWAGLLLVGGWALSRRAEARPIAIGVIAAGTLHALAYTLLLHNPLWYDQAVGAIPIINWLIPAFALVPAGLWLLAGLVPATMPRFEPARRVLHMILIVLFAYATLRQVFVGTVLTVPGLTGFEDIMRSIVAIALAIGFLLWGIRSNGRDWRIASLVLMLAAVLKVFLRDASGLEGLLRIGSFVALGFSLIGIGWLYSRQLSGGANKATES